jgi:hypothetical protein
MNEGSEVEMKTLAIGFGLVVGLGVLIVGGGCKDSAAPAAPEKAATEATTGSGIPDGVWLASSPAGAKAVAEVKKSAAAGQEVVLTGRIGGRKDPFVSGRAMFMLSDRSIPSCEETHGPGCATPWDYCCEPKETVLGGTLTVQIVGADGKPLKTGLEGAHGLKPLAEVVVKGKAVGTGSEMVIDATGIYVRG